jgi:hypothetical protein
MRRGLSFGATLLVPVLLLAGSVVGAAQKADLDKDKDVEKNTEKRIKAGQVVGVVKAVYEEKRTLRLDVRIPVPNLDAQRSLAQAQLQYQQALARRPVDINGARQAAQQIAQHQANLIKYETRPVEIQASEDVVVRAARPPEQFDEKGKIKKYTREELKELKGDTKLPGYKAEFSDIGTESIVQISLVKKKDASPKVVLPKKGKDREAEAALLGDNLPLASQIMILREAPPGK